VPTDDNLSDSQNRRGLAVCGNDAEAKAPMRHLRDPFGIDTVDTSRLKEGWRVQRDTPGYGPCRTEGKLRPDLAATKRHREMCLAKAAGPTTAETILDEWARVVSCRECAEDAAPKPRAS
jgi:hypothetical protein